MKLSVWDTYVTKRNGETMHFDILAPDNITDEATIHNYGKDYLKAKQQEGQSLTAKECRFCHQEVASPEMVAAVEDKGYYIIEMEGC